MKKIFLVLGGFALSFFIYCNVVERVFLIDLPYVSSVARTNSPKIIYNLSEEVSFASEREKYGFFGKPITLRAPRLDFVLNITESDIKKGEGWLVSRETGGFYVFAKSKGGHFGDMIIFGLPKGNSFKFVQVLTEGDRVMLDTDSGWRYNFRVAKRTVTPDKESYLLANSDKTRIILLDGSKENKSIIVEADFLSMEEKI